MELSASTLLKRTGNFYFLIFNLNTMKGFIYAFVVVIIIITTMYHCNKASEQASNTIYVNGSSYTVDLPEEMPIADSSDEMGARLYRDTIRIFFIHNSPLSYRVDLLDDGTMTVWNGNRFVGVMKYDVEDTSQFGRILNKEFHE